MQQSDPKSQTPSSTQEAHVSVDVEGEPKIAAASQRSSQDHQYYSGNEAQIPYVSTNQPQFMQGGLSTFSPTLTAAQQTFQSGSQVGLPYTTFSPSTGIIQDENISLSHGTQSEQNQRTDPYYLPYYPNSPTAGGQGFFPAATGMPGYAQPQFPSAGPYGMQYYAPYTGQPSFYQHRGQVSQMYGPSSQQVWRPAGAYSGYVNQPVSAFQRPPSSVSNRQRTASSHQSGGMRSMSSSSRTSPGSIPTPTGSQHHNVTAAATAAAAAKSASETNTIKEAGPTQVQRSEHVLWCGNVPADATVDELWSFFSQLSMEPGDTEPSTEATYPAHGVMSIFVISRSNCAFVNYATSRHLQHALKYFQGIPLRPHDPRCPKLVCRERKKDDEAQAGVAGQRGRGMHVAWLKEFERKAKEEKLAVQLESANDPTKAALSPGAHSATSNATQQQMTASTSSQMPSSMDSSSGSGSVSYASTSSSMFRHPAFRERYFILKSLRAKDLEISVNTGVWATQPHNEAVLDQAFRNSETVYLIFSANQSGGFFGYARMVGPINAANERASTIRPETITEDEVSDTKFDVQVAASPQQLTPVSETLPGTGRLGKKNMLKSISSSSLGNPTGPSKSKENTLMPAVSPAGEEASNTIVTSPIEEQEDPLREESQALKDLSLVSSSSEPFKRSQENQAKREGAGLNNASIGPMDSASYPSDARTQSQMALRALIHNIRLEERESVHRAKQLEAVEAELAAKEQSNNAGENSNASTNTENASASIIKPPQPLASSPETWGKTFKIEWIKAQPLPFSRVRRLRNPWRDNRQVKVSRDGTELEPGVGRQLLEEWGHVDAPSKEHMKVQSSAESPFEAKIASGLSVANAEDNQEDEDEDEEA